MRILSDEELETIEGGLNITGTLFNSFSTLMNTVSNLGKRFGSALRRIGSNRMCSLWT